MARRLSALLLMLMWASLLLGQTSQSVRITDVRWVAAMNVIEILFDSWPGIWPGWRAYVDGIEIPMEGSSGQPVIRPNAPLSKPPTGLFVGTLPWPTGLDNVDFPCCGTIQFFIPGRGLTNVYEYNLRDYGCKTASQKSCPSEAATWSSYPRGDQPWALAISPDGARVYVPCWMSNNVFVIDTATNRVIEVIDLSNVGPNGAGPRGAGVTPDGKKLYVVNARSNNISVIDTATHQVMRHIDLGPPEREIPAARSRAAPTTGDPHRPAKVLFTPDGRFAYTVLYTSLLILDVQQDKLISRELFEPGFYPFDLAMIHDGKKLYISGRSPWGPHTVTYVLDTQSNTFVEVFEVNALVEGRAGTALSPDEKILYLSSGDPFVLYDPTSGYNKIYFIDLLRKAVVKEVSVTGGPLRMRLSPDGQKAYVVTMATPELLVVDLVSGRLETSIQTRGLRGGLTDKVELVLTPDGRYAYIAALDQDGVMVVDLREKRMVKFIPFNFFIVQPYFMALSPDESRLYISALPHERRRGSVLAIDTQNGSILAEIMVPWAVRGLDVTPDGRFVYVALPRGKVWIVSTLTNTVVGEITLNDEGPNDVAIKPDGSKAYILGNRYVHVVELPGNRVIKTIEIGPELQVAAFSLDGSLLFVTLNRGGVVFINTSTDEVVAKVDPPEPIGAGAPKVGLAASPDGRRLYWAYFYDFFHVIDVASWRIIKTIHLGKARWEADCASTAITTTSDGSKIYVTMHDGNYVAVVDAWRWEILATISAGFAPTDIVMTRNNKLAYVVNFQSEDISVIDVATNKVVRTISVRPPGD